MWRKGHNRVNYFDQVNRWRVLDKAAKSARWVMHHSQKDNTEVRLLNAVEIPKDIRQLSMAELEQLSDEVRATVIQSVSHTGGHLGAGLGVVELTVALHHVFNTPTDKLVWDVGHQSYPHKVLTGRKNQLRTLRQKGGLSPFTKTSESIYDPFGAGHSSTSISAAMGMAIARDRKAEDYEVIAVIGDGAMSAGMAYEAMNNIGVIDNRLIVILNDNDMSIAPAVGAMSNYLSRLIASKPYLTFRNMAKNMVNKLPASFEKAARKAEKYAKHMATGGNIFEELGFYYVGPVDGHDLSQLLPILKNLRDDPRLGPVLLHVVTEKGRGFNSPETCAEKFHAVKKFDITTGIQTANNKQALTYTEVFAQSLIQAASKDDKIVALTAAMPSGTGLDKFADLFPDRMYDVGIAEQHAVTCAAGMASQGLKPVVAIYSTFLQRAYDQIIHDVAIQNLPVFFAIDRAGLVGEDGATHAGSYDLSMLVNLPNMVVMAASDEAELAHMVATATTYDKGPIALRYPRGGGVGVALPDMASPLPIGKGRIISKGKHVAILSLGTRLEEAKKAQVSLEKQGISVTVADARFAKPLDAALIAQLIEEHRLLITIEEGASGGFGAYVMAHVAQSHPFNKTPIIPLYLPDYFIEHAAMQAMYEEAGLNHQAIIQSVLDYFSLADNRKTA